MKTRYIWSGIGMLLAATVMLASVSGSAQASESAKYKIGSNVLAALAVGDANLTIEKSIHKLISLTASGHYIESSDIIPNEVTGMRASLGLRAYKTEGMEGLFVEFKGGMNYHENSDNSSVTGNVLSPSVELFVGTSGMFNDIVFFDAKAGAVRVLSTGDLVPGLGFSAGVKF